jgi:pectate lyase
MVLYENDKPLVPHMPHKQIAERGIGGFSHWKNILVFTSSDNSDPNTNGRAYSFAFKHSLEEARNHLRLT